jgi:macrodomain Ter protein organizer (MatP/YcbG family)
MAKVNAAETPALVKEWKEFADPKTASVNWEWPFPAKQYKVGDIVAYYVEVSDNCPQPGANVVKSQEYKVTVEAAQKVAEELKQKYTEWEQKLDKALRLQREARQEAGTAAGEK